MYKTISKYNSVFDNFSFHHSVQTVKDSNRLCKCELHNQFEIFYLIEGEIKYNIEGEEYLVNPGDVLFVSPNEVHSIEILGGVNYERIVVMFDLEKITQILQVGDMSLDKALFSNVRSFRVIPRELLDTTDIKEIMFSISEKKDEKFLPLFVLTKIFSLILELEKIFSKDGEGGFPLSIDKTVQKAIAYVNDNIEKPLTLNDIASALFVSKSSLCHKFAKSMRVTVNRYVTIKKIYYAAKLIKDGMGAIEASVAVGYNQYTTFYHNYRKILGTSPTGSK